jgi:prepilin-type N-terminal cleavage/methylation domain-containing protein
MHLILAKSKQGFTIIEMMVSLAVFAFVITIAIGALLMLVASSRQLQGEQSVMTNLSFALDAMTREIRTGSFYFCDSNSSKASGSIFNDNYNLESLGDSYRDCPNGNPSPSTNKLHGMAFKEGGDSVTTSASDRIVYFFDKDEGKIFRRVGSQAAESIVSSGIFIRNADFFVTGSKKSSLDGSGISDQPAVTIFIEAAESSDTNAKSYHLQTTITQRTLDL